jgi:hypothetical protein
MVAANLDDAMSAPRQAVEEDSRWTRDMILARPV